MQVPKGTAGQCGKRTLLQPVVERGGLLLPWEGQPSHKPELKVQLRLKLGCLGVSWPGQSGDCGHDIPDRRTWASGSQGHLQ